MDTEKRQRYEKIAAEIVRLAGGRDNILGVAHCATRLRLVLEDNDRADTGRFCGGRPAADYFRGRTGK